MTAIRNKVHERENQFVVVRCSNYDMGRWHQAKVVGRFAKGVWRDVYRFLDDWGFPSCTECGKKHREL